MFRAVILFCVVKEMQSVQYKYISRNSRSNSDPISTGYLYREFSNDPSPIATHYGGSFEDASIESLAEKYTPVDIKHTMISYAPIGTMKPHVDKNYIQPPVSKHTIDFELAKAESKYQSKFLPSKMETDAMYHRLKSIMHYHPPVGSDESAASYEHSNEYSLDDDDIRSSSRSSFGSWPYYYHPYEYEQMKIDAEFEKAKDKRYAIDNARAIIPVHEDLDGDPLNTYGPLSTISYYPDTVTDNPIYADKPFFSFVLNDYFDRNKEDDSFVFKGVDWGNDFDQGSTTPDLYDYYSKRPQRLESDYDWKEIPRYSDGTLDSLLRRSYDGTKTLQGEGIGQKLIDKIQASKYNESGHQENDKHITKYTHNGDKYNGFKDFADKFAKMFGSEDHKKESKYTFKRNQDKGEKKKGFRRVYQKNEYQEEDEFYDNNNSTANAEENGKSSGHIGGAEGFTRAQGNTAVENKASTFNKDGETDRQNFFKGHESFGSHKEHDKQFNKYRDVAKKTAQSNNADYTDHFRV